MINIIAAIISGFVVGVLARWLYPGDVPMGWALTVLLGIGGSLFAGLVISRGRGGFNQVGCFASVLGAMALILLARLIV